MATVNCSVSDSYRHVGENQHAETLAHIQTVKEKILQQCLKNLCTNSTEHGIAQGQKTAFVASVTEESVKVTGLLDYNTFKETIRSSNIQQELASCGLTTTEIGLVLSKDQVQHPSNGEPMNSLTSNIPKDIEVANILSSLNFVLKKISDRCDILNNESSGQERFHGAVELTRTEFEEAVREGRLERGAGTSQPFVKLAAKRQPAMHPDHPLNHLAALERELFQKVEYAKDKILVSDDSASQSKRFKRSKTHDQKQDKGSTVKETTDSTLKNIDLSSARFGTIKKRDELNSLWDVQDETAILDTNSKVVTVKPISYSIARTKGNKDFSRGFISLPDVGKLVPICEIKNNSIPMDQLKREFPNYNSGPASRTLYIKNLCHRTSAEDLVSVFGHFDTGPARATYRLLVGRMKGQAFVKFADTEAATAAICCCLGYRLRDKPMVIEYGRELTITRDHIYPK